MCLSIPHSICTYCSCGGYLLPLHLCIGFNQFPNSINYNILSVSACIHYLNLLDRGPRIQELSCINIFFNILRLIPISSTVYIHILEYVLHTEIALLQFLLYIYFIFRVNLCNALCTCDDAIFDCDVPCFVYVSSYYDLEICFACQLDKYYV